MVRKIELYRKTHGKEPAKRKCKPKQEPMRDIPKEQFKCTKRVKPVIRVETVRKSNYNVRPETSNKTKSEANVKAEKKIERDFKRESQKLEEEKRMYRETFFDPEIDEYMNDFEVFSAVLDISSTPMNVKKYLKNRKVMEVLKLMKKKSESRDWHPPRDPEFEKGLRDPEVTQAFLDFRRDGYISKKHNSNPKVVNALNLIANKFGVVPECSSCSAPLFPHSK